MSNSKKTIVIFSCFYEPFMSGAERFVKEIAGRLSEKYRFVIISAKIDKNLLNTEEKNRILIHRVGFGRKFDKWLYPIFAPIVALKYKPNLIHAVMESYAGIALWISSFLFRAPRILTLQSGDLDDVLKQEKIPFWLWKKIHISPDKITAISSFLKKRALGLGVSKDKVLIVSNGVDLEEVGVMEPIQKKSHKIICVGRLSWEKGHEFLLGAMPEILTEFSDARLVLVGDGPRKRELKELVLKLDLENAVEFCGLLPHNQTLEEIKKSSVFICPSLAEGLGIVFIEAQACGVPVIGTNVGGIPDVIQDGANGLLVPPGNSAAIAEAVRRIWKDETATFDLIQSARANVLRFDWAKIAEQISEIYQKMIF